MLKVFILSFLVPSQIKEEGYGGLVICSIKSCCILRYEQKIEFLLFEILIRLPRNNALNISFSWHMKHTRHNEVCVVLSTLPCYSCREKMLQIFKLNSVEFLQTWDMRYGGQVSFGPTSYKLYSFPFVVVFFLSNGLRTQILLLMKIITRVTCN